MLFSKTLDQGQAYILNQESSHKMLDKSEVHKGYLEAKR